MREIQLMLEKWGAWAANDNINLNWSHIAAGFKGLILDKSKSTIQCSDEEGLLIDKSIAKLFEFNQEGVYIIIQHYMMGFSLRAIAKKNKCSDGSIRMKLIAAEGFIYGCLKTFEIK